jgi:hypothetical protein
MARTRVELRSGVRDCRKNRTAARLRFFKKRAAVCVYLWERHAPAWHIEPKAQGMFDYFISVSIFKGGRTFLSAIDGLFKFQLIQASIKCRFLVIPAQAGIQNLEQADGFPLSRE